MVFCFEPNPLAIHMISKGTPKICWVLNAHFKGGDLLLNILMRFIVDKPYYFGNGYRFFDNELFETTCVVTESYVLPILAIRFFEKQIKLMKKYHRKHKKCSVLNHLHLRSLVFLNRLDWQNIWFCKTGVAETTIPTTCFNMFPEQI